ncbi:hypothetical protein ACP4OV_025223 [Aristida adscensionis]
MAVRMHDRGRPPATATCLDRNGRGWQSGEARPGYASRDAIGLQQVEAPKHAPPAFARAGVTAPRRTPFALPLSSAAPSAAPRHSHDTTPPCFPLANPSTNRGRLARRSTYAYIASPPDDHEVIGSTDRLTAMIGSTDRLTAIDCLMVVIMRRAAAASRALVVAVALAVAIGLCASGTAGGGGGVAEEHDGRVARRPAAGVAPPAPVVAGVSPVRTAAAAARAERLGGEAEGGRVLGGGGDYGYVDPPPDTRRRRGGTAPIPHNR